MKVTFFLPHPPPPPPIFEKVKFFIFGATVIKFESKHFHVFTIGKYDYLQYEKREKKNLKLVMFWIK